MSLLLARLARSITNHWKRSALIAFVVLIIIGALAGTGCKDADDFYIASTEAQQAILLFKAHRPAFPGADSTIVYSVSDGTLDQPERKAAIEGSIEEIKGLKGVEEVGDPFAKGASMSEDGRIAAIDVRYDVEPQDIESQDGKDLEAAARTAEKDGVQVSARGIVIDVGSEQDAPVGELIGVALAIVLLTILFRSGVAMVATLVGALLGVAVGQMLLAALAKPLGLPEFASIIAVMLGLGAGIDYALLIIGRYREQVAAGDSARDASAKAMGTSGTAVVAAGVVVMVAIAGLLVIGIPFIGKLGLAAAIAVGAVVVSALTILPIMMGALGRWLAPKKPEHVQPSPFFSRWAELITRRPWVSIVAGVLLLLV